MTIYHHYSMLAIMINYLRQLENLSWQLTCWLIKTFSEILLALVAINCYLRVFYVYLIQKNFAHKYFIYVYQKMFSLGNENIHTRIYIT